MPAGNLVQQIERRLALARVASPSPAAVAPALATYLELLARWNKRINLTAYSLDSPSDDAIDRLIVEPVAMARFVRPDDRVTIDVGSGGGSPALPFRLAAPSLRQVLVESRVRKAAFLREAVRQLGMEGVRVENCRLEEMSGDKGSAHIVTMRAVRSDAALLRAVQALMVPGGRFFWLTTEKVRQGAVGGFEVEAVESLVADRPGQLAILRPT